MTVFEERLSKGVHCYAHLTVDVSVWWEDTLQISLVKSYSGL